MVVVLDNERLFVDLRTRYKDNERIQMRKLAKSGGVVVRSGDFRKKARTDRFRGYFYGINNDLCPHSLTMNSIDFIVYQVGAAPAAPTSALPIGVTRAVNPLKLTEVVIDRGLLHSVLAISNAPSSDKILANNIAGLAYISDVNMEKQRVTILLPCAGPLPSRYFLSGSLKWLE